MFGECVVVGFVVVEKGVGVGVDDEFVGGIIVVVGKDCVLYCGENVGFVCVGFCQLDCFVKCQVGKMCGFCCVGDFCFVFVELQFVD